MNQKKSRSVLPEQIENKIYLIRGKKVILDSDLATLYGVPTFRFNEAVKRNKKRFPDDFMYQLTKEEITNLKSQFAISSWGGRRTLPYAFTQEGVAMLSSVLNSERAIQVNIQIMRTFTKLRELLTGNEEIKRKIEAMEKKFEKHDHQFQIVFDAIKRLLEVPEKPKRRIGFHAQKENEI